MNGILVVDKPTDWTSFDVIAKLRGVLSTRKLGHAGTLDPLATGVLPVFAGPAAKAVDMQLDHTKTYRAVIRFGLSTDTGDVTGEVLQTAQTAVSKQALAQVLPHFLGDQMQVPPMYSAVKIKGVPLYKLARQGLTVERKARPVTIHSLTLLGQSAEQDFEIEVSCSKGTYVRTLLEDLGKALHAPACLAALRRTRAGLFQIENSHTMQQIIAAQQQGCLNELFLPVESVFMHLPTFEANDEILLRLYNGAPCYRIPGADGVYRLHGQSGFVGLAKLEGGRLSVEKLFIERA